MELCIWDNFGQSWTSLTTCMYTCTHVLQHTKCIELGLVLRMRCLTCLLYDDDDL